MLGRSIRQFRTAETGSGNRGYGRFDNDAWAALELPIDAARAELLRADADPGLTSTSLGVGPLTSLAVVVPLMAVIGYALQRGLLNYTLGDDLLPPLLVTFGLSIIIQNGLLELFTADSRKLQAGAIEIQEMGQAENPHENRCDPGMRQLARYRGLLDGDVLTLGKTEVRFQMGRLPANHKPPAKRPARPAHSTPSR